MGYKIEYIDLTSDSDEVLTAYVSEEESEWLMESEAKGLIGIKKCELIK